MVWCVCDRCMAEHRENWDLMSAAGSVAAIDDPVLISSGEAWSIHVRHPKCSVLAVQWPFA